MSSLGQRKVNYKLRIQKINNSFKLKVNFVMKKQAYILRSIKIIK